MSLHLLPVLQLLYVGPDQLMPLTSALAAIGGAIMIFWRQVKGLALRLAGVFRKKAPEAAVAPVPAPETESKSQA